MLYQGMRAQVEDRPHYPNESLSPGTTSAHTIRHLSGQHMVQGTEQIMGVPNRCFEMNPRLVF